MKPAPPTPDEGERIEKLNAYSILDTLPEQVYDDIVQLASSICGTPIALISLVDSDRQWFKAKVGLEASETPRDLAFCAHAIHGQEVFEINDARLDERFSDNPLVTEEPHVIFYAGSPIITPEGYKLGTLCVIDREPQSLNNAQKVNLERLSRQVAYLFEQRIVSAQLDQTNQKLLEANEELTHFAYRASHDLKSPLVSMRRLLEFVVQDVEEGNETEAISNIGKVSSLTLRLESVVSNVLALHRAGAAARAQAPFLVAELIEEVQTDLKWLIEDAQCEMKINTPSNLFTFGDKTRVRQIVENLVSNALKYRDPAKDKCTVKVACSTAMGGSGLCIEIADNGLGIEEKFHNEVMGMFKRFHSGFSEGSGLGLAIVKKNVEALGGTIEFSSVPGIGTTFSVSLPQETLSETNHPPADQVAQFKHLPTNTR